MSDKNEGIGAYNGEAEIDEDNGALGADIPGVLKREKKRRSLGEEWAEERETRAHSTDSQEAVVAGPCL